MIYFKTYRLFSFLLLMLAGAALLTSCKKYLPEDRENIGLDSDFTQTLYQPVLGRTTLFTNNFYQGSTTFPADFKMVNPRRINGDAAPELQDLFPVKVWKEAYTGTEATLAEIEAKRQTQYRPLFEIFPHSGQFTMWAEATSDFIHSQPDSGYLFDVEMSNSGGRRYFRNLRLRPMKERPYEPSNLDPVTGQSLSTGIFPSRINMRGQTKERNLSLGDVRVFIRKRTGDENPANTLRFIFLDTLYNPIDPAKFSGTDWEGLVHGFNRKMTATDVTYEVAYPIPLAAITTRYITPGAPGRAAVTFYFPRLGFGGLRDDGMIGLDFAIYQPGDWEIVFAFINDNPKFDND